MTEKRTGRCAAESPAEVVNVNPGGVNLPGRVLFLSRAQQAGVRGSGVGCRAPLIHSWGVTG